MHPCHHAVQPLPQRAGHAICIRRSTILLECRHLTHLPALVHPEGQGSRPSLFGADIGDSLPRFLQGLQQSIHAVLRVDANLLVGQVDLKLDACRKRRWSEGGGSRGPGSQSEDGLRL